jgi:hypothetical protein
MFFGRSKRSLRCASFPPAMLLNSYKNFSCCPILVFAVIFHGKTIKYHGLPVEYDGYTEIKRIYFIKTGNKNNFYITEINIVNSLFFNDLRIDFVFKFNLLRILILFFEINWHKNCNYSFAIRVTF